ncbi:hypothetical protein CS022_13440 [Veronia nyctiphanis]|uniref:DUF6817 domain-containing protein n=1 Tax=Veronia nyctiphanis TaxID=1278244 RepID=A0A4Q0YPD4_9GAMM|nr:hypothetical protein CS022_13440 [Veronia nyctiphanis]
MDNQFQQLKHLGAGDFQHLNGSLETHLQGTEALLREWQADDILRTAGLFHAAYGTAGFDEQMVSLSKRAEIADVIGVEAEALVYLYCSCDRDVVFPQFSGQKSIQFKDRFTGDVFSLKENQCRYFCELTVANELELVKSSASFKAQYGRGLLTLFTSMNNYLSEHAIASYEQLLQ